MGFLDFLFGKGKSTPQITPTASRLPFLKLQPELTNTVVGNLVELDLIGIPFDSNFLELGNETNSQGATLTRYVYVPEKPLAGLFTKAELLWFDEGSKNLILTRPTKLRVNIKALNEFMADLVHFFGSDDTGAGLLTPQESAEIKESDFSVIVSRSWILNRPPVYYLSLSYTDFGEDLEDPESGDANELNFVIHWSMSAPER